VAKLFRGKIDWVNPARVHGHLIVFNAEHLGRILSKYATYYNEVRTHLALDKDAPLGRTVQRSGAIVAIPILAGLSTRLL
jgi:hypothetical protein